MKWVFYKGKHGKYRWRVLAKNGKIIGASTQGYKRKQDCKNNAKLFGWKK